MALEDDSGSGGDGQRCEGDGISSQTCRADRTDAFQGVTLDNIDHKQSDRLQRLDNRDMGLNNKTQDLINMDLSLGNFNQGESSVYIELRHQGQYFDNAFSDLNITECLDKRDAYTAMLGHGTSNDEMCGNSSSATASISVHTIARPTSLLLSSTIPKLTYNDSVVVSSVASCTSSATPLSVDHNAKASVPCLPVLYYSPLHATQLSPVPPIYRRDISHTGIGFQPSNLSHQGSQWAFNNVSEVPPQNGSQLSYHHGSLLPPGHHHDSVDIVTSHSSGSCLSSASLFHGTTSTLTPITPTTQSATSPTGATMLGSSVTHTTTTFQHPYCTDQNNWPHNSIPLNILNTQSQILTPNTLSPSTPTHNSNYSINSPQKATTQQQIWVTQPHSSHMKQPESYIQNISKLGSTTKADNLSPGTIVFVPPLGNLYSKSVPLCSSTSRQNVINLQRSQSATNFLHESLLNKIIEDDQLDIDDHLLPTNPSTSNNEDKNRLSRSNFTTRKQGCLNVDLWLTVPLSPVVRSGSESVYSCQGYETASLHDTDSEEDEDDSCQEEAKDVCMSSNTNSATSHHKHDEAAGSGINNPDAVSHSSGNNSSTENGAHDYSFGDRWITVLDYEDAEANYGLEPMYDEYELASDEGDDDADILELSDSDIDVDFAVAATAAIAAADDTQLSDEFADQSAIDSDAADTDELDMASFFIAFTRVHKKRLGNGYNKTGRFDGESWVASSENSDSDGLQHADRWKCLECGQMNNRSFFRYCEKCWKMRRGWLPTPPKKRRKRKPRNKQRRRRSDSSKAARVSPNGDMNDSKAQCAGSTPLHAADTGTPLNKQNVTAACGGTDAAAAAEQDIISVAGCSNDNKNFPDVAVPSGVMNAACDGPDTNDTVKLEVASDAGLSVDNKQKIPGSNNNCLSKLTAVRNDTCGGGGSDAITTTSDSVGCCATSGIKCDSDKITANGSRVDIVSDQYIRQIDLQYEDKNKLEINTVNQFLGSACSQLMLKERSYAGANVAQEDLVDGSRLDVKNNEVSHHVSHKATLHTDSSLIDNLSTSNKQQEGVSLSPDPGPSSSGYGKSLCLSSKNSPNHDSVIKHHRHSDESVSSLDSSFETSMAMCHFRSLVKSIRVPENFLSNCAPLTTSNSLRSKMSLYPTKVANTESKKEAFDLDSNCSVLPQQCILNTNNEINDIHSQGMLKELRIEKHDSPKHTLKRTTSTASTVSVNCVEPNVFLSDCDLDDGNCSDTHDSSSVSQSTVTRVLESNMLMNMRKHLDTMEESSLIQTSQSADNSGSVYTIKSIIDRHSDTNLTNCKRKTDDKSKIKTSFKTVVEDVETIPNYTHHPAQEVDRISIRSAADSIRSSAVDSGMGSGQDLSQESSQEYSQPQEESSNFTADATKHRNNQALATDVDTFYPFSKNKDTSPAKEMSTAKVCKRSRFSNYDNFTVDIVNVVIDVSDTDSKLYIKENGSKKQKREINSSGGGGYSHQFENAKRKRCESETNNEQAVFDKKNIVTSSSSKKRKKIKTYQDPVERYLTEGLFLLKDDVDVTTLPETVSVRIITDSIVKFLESDRGKDWITTDVGRSWFSSGPVQATLLASMTNGTSSVFDNLCITCQDRPKDATIIHGKTSHQATCYKCAKTLYNRKQRCPVCRRKILRISKNIIV